MGPYIDRYGRKKACILYCVLEILIQILEHSPNFQVLLCGRVIGGLTTALLFTALESWMITEHRRQGHPEELLADTFSLAATGNGLMAVLAGVVAQWMMDQYGDIGPFRAALALTAVALLAILLSWDENRGDTNSKPCENTVKQSALSIVLSNRPVLLVGLVQAFFEGAMYTFVFNWVPTLMNLFPPEHSFGKAQGLIFAQLMLCMAIGGSLFTQLGGQSSVGKLTIAVLAVAALSMLVPVVSTDLMSVVLAFYLMEASVGLFGPCCGTLRSKVVPEEINATVMNLFRVPLNILVVIGTKLDNYTSSSGVFFVCFVWLAIAALIAVSLQGSHSNRIGSKQE